MGKDRSQWRDLVNMVMIYNREREREREKERERGCVFFSDSVAEIT